MYLEKSGNPAGPSWQLTRYKMFLNVLIMNCHVESIGKNYYECQKFSVTGENKKVAFMRPEMLL
jgi:hypothetical protein